MSQRSFYFTLAGVTVGALGVSFLMMPQAEHIPLMLMADGQYGEALDAYQERIRTGDIDPSIVMPIIRILQANAQDRDAIALVEGYVAKHPRAIEPRVFLTSLYEESRRYHPYVDSMRAQAQLHPTEELWREIRNMSEVLGKKDAEVEALYGLIGMGKAKQEEYLRLAYFHSQGKNFEAALELIRPYITLEKFSELHVDTLELALVCLHRLKRYDEAATVIGHYLMTISKPEEVDALASILIDEGAYDQVLMILERPEWREHRNEPLLHKRYIALDLSGRKEELTVFLKNLTDEQRLPKDLKPAALSAAVTAEEPQWVASLLEQVQFKNVPQELIERLLAWTLRTKNLSLAQSIAQKSSPQYLQSFPAVDYGLKLLLDQLSEEQAEDLWQDLEAQNRLDDNDRVTLAGFSAALDYGALVHDIALAVEDPDSLEADEFYMFVNILIILDEDQRALAAVENVQPWGDSDPDIVETAWALAYLAAGGEETVIDWMEQEESIDPGFLQDLFHLAVQEKASEAAIETTERLLEQRHTPLHEAFHAHAKVLNGDIDDGLLVLRKYSVEDVKIYQTYLQALTSAASQEPQHLEELHAVLTEEATQPRLNAESSSQLAYTLVKSGLDAEAEPLLRALAENAPFSSGPVQTLLGVWKDQPTDAQKEWIFSRASQAQGKERAGWIRYLMDLQEHEKVIELTREEDLEDQGVLEANILALINLKRESEAMDYTYRLLEGVEDGEELKQLALEAKWAVASDIAEILYLKILELDPEDTAVYKDLGSVAYRRGQYTLAYDYLFMYLEEEGPDFLAYHLLAEIFYRDYHDQEARSFNQCALSELNKLMDKGPHDLAIEAHVLQRLDQIPQADALYRRIISENPKTLAFRADYANMLIEQERFGSAECVLAQAIADAEAAGETSTEDSDELALLRGAFIVLLQRTNRQAEAWCVSHYSMNERPDDPIFYHSAADVDLYTGQWRRSLGHLADAAVLAPKDEGLIKLRHKLSKALGPYMSLEGQYRKTGKNQTDFFLRFHHEDYIAWCTRCLFDIETDTNDTDALIRTPSGAQAPFEKTRYRTRLGLRQEFESGNVLEGSLVWSHDVFGLAGLARVPDFCGQTSYFCSLYEPNWDFVAALAQNGARHRIGVSRLQRIHPRIQLTLGVAQNYYYIHRSDYMGRTYTLSGAASYTFSPLNCLVKSLGRQSIVRLDYLLDVERVQKEVLITVPGPQQPNEAPPVPVTFSPLGLGNREIHTGAFFIRQRLNPCFAWEGSAGYSYDRVGAGGGPIGGVGLWIGREEYVHSFINYSHTVSTQGTESAADTFTVQLKYPF